MTAESPIDHYGDMFVSHDLRMALESEMLDTLRQAVDGGWYSEHEAAEAYAEWHRQFE